MGNQSNVNRRNLQRSKTTNPLLQDLHSYDFVRTFPPSWKLPTNISNENRNIDRLKHKIDCFFQEHSNLIMDIKNYFYDEMMMYAFKRAFKLPFNKTDMIRTERLLNRFFNDHESNIKIIFHYFFDDIKPFLLNNDFLYLTSELHRINAMLNHGTCEATIYLFKAKGAQFLTSVLYPTNIVLNSNENLSEQSSVQTQSTPNLMKFGSILIYVCVLCIIFGWKIFLIMFHFCVGFVIIAFFLHLLMKPHAIKHS